MISSRIFFTPCMHERQRVVSAQQFLSMRRVAIGGHPPLVCHNSVKALCPLPNLFSELTHECLRLIIMIWARYISWDPMGRRLHIHSVVLYHLFQGVHFWVEAGRWGSNFEPGWLMLDLLRYIDIYWTLNTRWASKLFLESLYFGNICGNLCHGCLSDPMMVTACANLEYLSWVFRHWDLLRGSLHWLRHILVTKWIMHYYFRFEVWRSGHTLRHDLSFLTQQ